MTTGLQIHIAVRVSETTTLTYYRGKTGRVTRILADCLRYPYEVDFGDGMRVCFSTEELEMVR